MGEFLTKLFGSAAGEGIKGVTGILGSQGFMDLLGSEGFKNLLEGGSGLMQANMLGDSLDFQKDLATKADARTGEVFNREMEKDDNRMEAFDEGAKLLDF